jgi:hypothetical protein
MAQGYIRNDTANNIADANIIDAVDLDNEFDAIVAAFASVTGHAHDGTAANGGTIGVLGPNQDVVVTSTVLRPKTDNTVDLGTSTLEFKDLYIDGVANIDSLVADTADINAGTIDNTSVGATTASTVRGTTITATTGFSGDITGGVTVGVGKTLDVSAGTLTLTDDQISGDKVEGGTINAITINTLTSTTVNTTTVDTTNLEVTSLKAKDGTAAGSIANTTGVVTIPLLTSAGTVNFAGATVSNGGSVTTVDINGGTIDNASIGASTASTVRGTTITATTGFTGDLTGNVTASTGSTTLNNLTVNGTVDVTNARIQNVATPTATTDATTKAYVDTAIASVTTGGSAYNPSNVTITGGSITGITDIAIADGGTGASTATDARTNLGLSTMATQASTSVSITGGTITGITDLTIADGGTGASTATDARTNLGLGTMATQAASSVTVTGGTINGTTVGATTAAAGTFTAATAATGRLTATPDVTLAGTTHALQIGPSSAANLSFDTADIQARNNGAASAILLNTLGGNVTLGSGASTVSVPGTVSIGSGAINNTTIGATTATTGAFTTATATTGNITTAVLGLGTALLPSATFTGDTNTGMWSPGADTLALSTGGSERLRLASTGNLTVNGTTFNVDAVNNRVGVGTSTPTTALDVAGTVNATGLSLSGTAVTSTAAELNILDGVTANTAQLNSSSEDVNAENRIINGDFGIWQRGTTSTAVGYGAADRWRQTYIGGTVTQTQVPVSGGPAVSGNNLTAFLRQTVSGQTLASHFAATEQRIEDVRNYAGKTITILGWAKRNSGTGNMAVEAAQYFGTGGAPSAGTSTNGQIVTLTTGFTPFAATVSLSSLIAKTLGTDGNHALIIRFWTSAGSDQSSPSGFLGLQTIGVDLWGIHIRQGVWTAADASLYRPRDPATELALCQRYFEVGNIGDDGGLGTKYGSAGATKFNSSHMFQATKRAVPVIAFTGTPQFTNCSTLTSTGSPTGRSFTSRVTVTALGDYRCWDTNWTADAEL